MVTSPQSNHDQLRKSDDTFFQNFEMRTKDFLANFEHLRENRTFVRAGVISFTW